MGVVELRNTKHKKKRGICENNRCAVPRSKLFETDATISLLPGINVRNRHLDISEDYKNSTLCIVGESISVTTILFPVT